MMGPLGVTLVALGAVGFLVLSILVLARVRKAPEIPARTVDRVRGPEDSGLESRLARLATLLSLKQSRALRRTPDIPKLAPEDQLPHVPPPHFDAAEEERAHLPIAAALELPDAIISRINDPDDLAGIVRAILEHAGLRVRAHGDLLVTGDCAVVVIPGRFGRPLIPDELNGAYLRFTQSGARRGVVATLGYMDRADVRRRERLAPAVLHAGPATLRRMARAAALGVNPLDFVRAA